MFYLSLFLLVLKGCLLVPTPGLRNWVYYASQKLLPLRRNCPNSKEWDSSSILFTAVFSFPQYLLDLCLHHLYPDKDTGVATYSIFGTRYLVQVVRLQYPTPLMAVKNS